MIGRRVKCLLVAGFSLFCMAVSAQEREPATRHIHNQSEVAEDKGTTKKFDANEVIFGHVLDAHQFHFMTYKGSDGQEHHVGISLPVLLYSSQRGFSAFSSAKFHHGE